MNVWIEICMVGRNLKPKTRNCLNKKFERGHTVLNRFFRLGISKQLNSIFFAVNLMILLNAIEFNLHLK